jgi:uncharacterized protein YuzE
MKITYDEEVDALYISFKFAKQVETRHYDEEIAFDYDEEGKIAGIEVLEASRKLAEVPKKDVPVKVAFHRGKVAAK